MFLDLFDALNAAVVSVCPWFLWLLSDKPKHQIPQPAGQNITHRLSQLQSESP